MPVYNSTRTINRALGSLLAQDFEDFELIISDNASTDETPEICKSHAAEDRRVRYHRRDANHGQLSNFDHALRMASGRYFMWAADDDYWEPVFLSTLLHELEGDSQAGAAMCALKRVSESGATYDFVRFDGRDDPGRMSPRSLLMAMATGFSNKRRYHLMLYGLYRTDLLKSARPYCSEQVPHPDRVFMCQFALGTRFRYVDQPLLVRTVRDQPSHVRLPDEGFNQSIIDDKWGYARTVLALGRSLLMSRIVPWYRKAYVPLAVAGMAWSYRGLLYRGRLPLPVRAFLTLGRRTLGLLR